MACWDSWMISLPRWMLCVAISSMGAITPANMTRMTETATMAARFDGCFEGVRSDGTSITGGISLTESSSTGVVAYSRPGPGTPQLKRWKHVGQRSAEAGFSAPQFGHGPVASDSGALSMAGARTAFTCRMPMIFSGSRVGYTYEPPTPSNLISTPDLKNLERPKTRVRSCHRTRVLSRLYRSRASNRRQETRDAQEKLWGLKAYPKVIVPEGMSRTRNPKAIATRSIGTPSARVSNRKTESCKKARKDPPNTMKKSPSPPNVQNMASAFLS